MDEDAFADFLASDYEVDGPELSPSARDGVIFLIDCTTTMVSEKLPSVLVRGSADTGLKLALMCCQNFMESKALSSPEDMVGLVFFRTGTSTLPEHEGVNIIQNLDMVSAPRILEVEKIREMSSRVFLDFYDASPSADGYPIHEALWTCQNMFNQAVSDHATRNHSLPNVKYCEFLGSGPSSASLCRVLSLEIRLRKKSLGYKRVLLMTDDPDPIGGKIQLKRQAIFKAKNLWQSGVAMEVIPIPQDGIIFDMGAFYEHLLPMGLGSTSPLEQADRLNDLLTREISLEPSRRRLSRLPLYLVPSASPASVEGTVATKSPSQTLPPAFGVAAYCLVRRAPPPRQVRIYAKTNEPVFVKRRFYRVSKGVKEHDEALIMPQDIVKGLRIGNRTVCLHRNDLSRRSTQVVPVGVHLLGFKPLEKLKFWCQLKTAQFLYPDEGLAKGSTLWFTTLLSACLRKKVFATALYVQRRGLTPRLVALVPQAEEVDEFGIQVASPGFHVLCLPYREDIRPLKFSKRPLAGREEVMAAKDMIKKASIAYRPDAIPNPSLQRRNTELEALALERTAHVVVDRTQPDLEKMIGHAGKEIERFADLFLQSSRTSTTSTPKTAPLPDPVTVEELRAYVDRGALSELTAPMLRRSIATLGLKPASNKKADLVASIIHHFNDDNISPRPHALSR